MDDEDGKAAAAAAEGSYSPTSFAPRPTRPRRPAKVLYIYSPCRWWVAAPKKNRRHASQKAESVGKYNL